MLLALRQQAWAAKQIASLQYLSGGRVQLGVGVGGVGSPDEWQAAGVPNRGRAARTDAMLAGLPDLLAGRPTAQVTEPGAPVVTLEPAVPMPPLWIGGTSDAALRRTVAHGAGWLAALLTPDALAARVADLAATVRAHATPMLPVGTIVFAAPTAEPGESTTRQVVNALHDQYGMDPDHARAVMVGGGPDQLADGLAAYRAAGASTLVIVPYGNEPAVSYQLLGQIRDRLT